MFNAKMKVRVNAWIGWLWNLPKLALRVPFWIGVCLAFQFFFLIGIVIIWGVFGFVGLNWDVLEWDVGARFVFVLVSLVWFGLLCSAATSAWIDEKKKWSR